jgi:hypothetical protein
MESYFLGGGLEEENKYSKIPGRSPSQFSSLIGPTLSAFLSSDPTYITSHHHHFSPDKGDSKFLRNMYHRPMSVHSAKSHGINIS